MNKKKISIAVLATVVVLGGGGAAFHARGETGSHSIAPAEGGEWDYGASGGRTWSNFKNEKPHRASVQGHEFVDSGCVQGGEWARAQAPSKWVPITKNEQSIDLCEGN